MTNCPGYQWACKVIQSILGWRVSMEDSHIANTSLPNNISIFGVFDGHGGAEVSAFVAKHFIDALKK
jgi:protein phosphatase 1G